VAGIGFAATRDFNSFLRGANGDDGNNGNQNQGNNGTAATAPANPLGSTISRKLSFFSSFRSTLMMGLRKMWLGYPNRDTAILFLSTLRVVRDFG
jgi:hypothetical protein